MAYHEFMSLEFSMVPSSANHSIGNHTHPLTPEQQKVILATKAVFSSLSLVFATAYILYVITKSCITFPWRTCSCRSRVQLRATTEAISRDCFFFNRPITRLFFFLQICAALSVSQVWIEVAKLSHIPVLCYYQALSIQFWSVASYCLSFVISVWMFWILVLKTTSTLHILEIASHVFTWTITIICTVVPGVTKSYGDAGGFCWIKNDRTIDVTWRFVFHIGPQWLCFALCLILFLITMISVLHHQIKSFHYLVTTKKKVRQIQTSMKLYIKLLGIPVVFILISSFFTLGRILEAALDYIPFPVLMLHSLFSLSNGFLITIVFLLSEVAGLGCDTINKGKSGQYLLTDSTLTQSRPDVRVNSEIYNQFVESNLGQYDDDSIEARTF